MSKLSQTPTAHKSDIIVLKQKKKQIVSEKPSTWFSRLQCIFSGHKKGEKLQVKGRKAIYLCARCGNVFSINVK